MSNLEAIIISIGDQMKKCKVNISVWKDEKRKLFRESGNHYVSWIEKTVSECRCLDACYRPGFLNLSLPTVLRIFKEFEKLSYKKLSMFLLKRMINRDPMWRSIT